MGRLILHIGTHKTGTTSIQRGLSRNREVLKENGIWYPNYDLIDKRGHYAHIGIANAFSGAHPDLTRKDAVNFFSQVAEQSKYYDTTIISAESFFRHVSIGADGQPQKIPGLAENYWPKRIDYISEVRDHFPVDDIEIAMVVRRQIEYGQSLYQEHIKTSGYRGDFSEFRNSFWHRFDYLRQARAWAQVFGKLHVLRFEDLIKADNIMDEFGTGIDVALSGLSSVPVENASLSPDLVVWKRMMNGRVGAKQLRKDIEKLGSSTALREFFKSMPKRSLFQDKEDALDFYAQYVDANELLKYEFMPKEAQNAPMFKEEFNDDLAFGDSLHPQFLNQLTKFLLSAGQNG
jgi:hypothetical protein